jgi:[ribosomal protein S5]-alanine N-acetyltransferase
VAGLLSGEDQTGSLGHKRRKWPRHASDVPREEGRVAAPTQSDVARSREYSLKTARLGFRRWSMEDLPLALALWGDPEVARFIGGPFSPEAVRRKLSEEILSMRAHNVQYWPLFMLSTSEHVGCAGLRPYRLEDKLYEMGFHLRPAYWGRGLAVEAGRAVVLFAFDTLGAQAIFAGHHPANTASRTVLQKLGFRFTHKEFYPPTGLEHPSYLLTRPKQPRPTT